MGDACEHYRAANAMTCRCVAFALPCSPCCALPFGKLPARCPTQNPTCRPLLLEVGLKRGRLRNRYSIPHYEPATTTVSAPAVVFTHFHSIPPPRATLTASVVDRHSSCVVASHRLLVLHHLYQHLSRITPRQAPHPTCSPAETLIIATSSHS